MSWYWSMLYNKQHCVFRSAHLVLELTDVVALIPVVQPVGVRPGGADEAEGGQDVLALLRGGDLVLCGHTTHYLNTIFEPPH